MRLSLRVQTNLASNANCQAKRFPIKMPWESVLDVTIDRQISENRIVSFASIKVAINAIATMRLATLISPALTFFCFALQASAQQV